MVAEEVMRSDSGCVFMIGPRGSADGLDGRWEKKGGSKGSPWSCTRAIVQMVVPLPETGSTKREGLEKKCERSLLGLLIPE